MNAYLHDNSELSFRGMNILTSHWVTSQPKPQKCKLAVEPNADVHTSLRFKGVEPPHMTTHYMNVEGHNDLLCTSIMEAFSCKNRHRMFSFPSKIKIKKIKKVKI